MKMPKALRQSNIMSPDPARFVAKLQSILAEPLCLEGNPRYIDLSRDNQVDDDGLHSSLAELPPSDPLIKALTVILQSMERGPFDLTRLGINELLKSYLFRVDETNQENCTHCYLNCIYQLYLFGLLENYPYTDLFWEFLSLCFDTVSKYLIEHKLDRGCQVFLNKVSTMGKWAAQKGLHTSSIQHFLHNMEIWAREEGFSELADSAKNHRFNLETF